MTRQVTASTADMGVIFEKKKLPGGWEWAQLGDVADYINGRAFKPEDWGRSGLPIIRIQNLNSDKAHFNYYDGQVEEKYEVNFGDLLISWSASLDAFIWKKGKAILNQHIFKVIERTGVIDRQYLYFAAREVMSEIRSQVHGATMKHITKPEFERIRIPLPPIDEQKRIAARLNQQTATVELARKAAEEQLVAAKALPAAYLREVFECVEAKQWKSERVGNISSLIIDGPHVTPTYVSNGVPFLTVRNIVKRRIDFSETSFISEADHEEFKKRGHAVSGNILYTKDGTLGIPCVVETDREFSFFVSVALIKLKQEIADPYFISFALESPRVLEQVELLGAGAGLKHMVLRSINALEVPLPPLSTQQRIAARIKAKMAQAESLKAMLSEQMKTVDRLPPALLRRAFNGEV